MCTVAHIDDMGRPMLVDNSTGVPQYKHIEEGDGSLSKRSASADWRRLWPGGVVYYQLQSGFSGYLVVQWSSTTVLQINVYR